MRTALVLCLSGVALRLVFLFLARDIDLIRDESHYVYLAIAWNRLGFLLDSHRYLWPPGYPFFLAKCFAWFDLNGPFVAKFVQVMASAAVGLGTMALARRLFDPRACLVAGVLWAVYLPLIGFTHTLWNETLFLALATPAFVWIAAVLDETEPAHTSNLAVEPSIARLIGAGVLCAAALYLKDALLYLLPALALLLVVFRRGAPFAAGLRQGLLFLLVTAVFVLPWTLRNAEVYGRVIPLGSTLAENMYRGVNATYRNFDLAPFQRRFFDEKAPSDFSRQWFIAREGSVDWERVEGIHNTADRLSASVARGTRFALDDPAWMIRSRIKKLADLVAPYSFFVRHLGIGGYDGTLLAETGPRRILLIWAILCPVVVLFFAVPGMVGLLRRPKPSTWLVVVVMSYFTATSLLVSMSRFRVPILPFAIALAAGFLAGRRGELRRDSRFWAFTAFGWMLLLFLWWVNAPETLSILQFVWRGTGETAGASAG